ncbi:hypothetical protein L211DRAFT_462713 [Terfezia boudieri ATCC MYA-4762]|uniref:Uncharacterized protein n=1 Tax=Terfezia boudieri ATCC MYA-4762 TaxID=1051890 RepID=A0A3N4LDM0_9PEZI|nr:hypothetical protein L211DRAFT_462713 [Terfezia boudieri ATCC MYA-4762]
MNIQKGFENMAVINVNYGNGSAASDMDIRIGAQASLSLRLLFEYFRPQDSPKAPLNYGGFINLHAKNPQHLTLHTALSVIAKDFTTHKQKGSDATVVIVVGIDEINRLHDWNKEVLRHLIHSIGAVMCSPPMNIYFIPILAGTIEGPLERYISGSMHKALPLPLPLLSVDDAIKISNLGEVDGFEEYVALNPSFRMSVSDLGGHARTLEYFYERFTQLVKQDKCSFSDINIVKIISKVRDMISNDYQLKRLPKQLEGVAIKVLLNQEVKESDLVAGSGESYRDFSDKGVLSLIPSPRHGFWKIRIPYLWLCTFMEFSDSPVRKYWEEMLKYDEPMYWQNFEMFNLKFLAMRLTLLRMTGLTKVDLKEFLQGAIFSEQFPEVDIILPTEARLGQMRYRYPETETGTIRQSGDNAREFHTISGVSITKIDCLPNEDIYKHCGRVILNAPGACWDLFMFLEIQYRGKAQGKIGTLCLTGQVKKANVESSNPLVANDHLISTEHAKAAKAVSNIPIDEWVYLFLADADTRNLDIKTKDNCAFVGDGEFANFYGYSYSSRAQFASANEIIYINHAYPKSLQILGFSEEEAKDIVTKRKRRCFDSLDDVRKRLGLGNKRLQNTISFARLT